MRTRRRERPLSPRTRRSIGLCATPECDNRRQQPYPFCPDCAQVTNGPLW